MADGRQVSLYLRWEAIEALSRHVERTGRSKSQCASELLVRGARAASIQDSHRQLQETHDKGEAR